MSGLDSIPLDPSGFLDMDQFPDTELADDALADLHDALLADPVDEPVDDDWSDLLGAVADDDAVGDEAALALDEADDLTFDADGDGDLDLAPDADDLIDTDLYGDDDLPDPDDVDDLTPDLDPHDVDDLTPDLDGEAPADISHDFEDYL